MSSWGKSFIEECEKNYSAGGHYIVETTSVEDLEKEFDNKEQAIGYIGAMVSQALECREGSDNDPELKEYELYKEWSRNGKKDWRL